jgi:hypothetical protein
MHREKYLSQELVCMHQMTEISEGIVFTH